MKHKNRSKQALGLLVAGGILATSISAHAFDVKKTYSGGSKSLFGYRAGYEATDQRSEPGRKWKNGKQPAVQLSAKAYAKAQAFGKEKEVVSVGAWGYSFEKKDVKVGEVQSEGAYTVSLLGKKVASKRITIKRHLPKDKKLSWVKQVTFAKARFSVGPVPVTLKAGASFEAKPRVEASVSLDPIALFEGTPYEKEPYAHLGAGPEADLAVIASAEAGWSNVAAIGVKNTLNLYKAALVAQADYFPLRNALVGKVVKEETGIHGKLEVYLEFLFKDYDKTVARYGDSTPKVTTLWSSVEPFDPSKGVSTPPATPAVPTGAEPRWSQEFGVVKESAVKSMVFDMPIKGWIKVNAGALGLESARTTVTLSKVGGKVLGQVIASKRSGESTGSYEASRTFFRVEPGEYRLRVDTKDADYGYADTSTFWSNAEEVKALLPAAPPKPAKPSDPIRDKYMECLSICGSNDDCMRSVPGCGQFI